MTEKTEPTVTVVVNAGGVTAIQFCGESWQDEEETQEIYQRIKPLIQQIDLVLKEGMPDPKRVQ